MADKKMKFGTRAIHGGLKADPSTGAVMTPIFQTSTYKQASPGEHKGYAYSRTTNPTREALENNLASLENGNFALCFGSGMAAIDAVLKLLKPGDEVISTADLYGGSYRLFTQIYAPFGIKFHFVSMDNPENIEPLINSKSRLIWLETPTNPMVNIIDIAAVSELAQKHKLILAVDNTFASPYLQRPLELGADLVMHSLTKYLAGHSDVVMGALVCKDERLAKKLQFIQNSSGAIPGPQDCFLVLRGIKTLHLRMQRHSENAKVLAHFLLNHPRVKAVYWPGFEDHPNHKIAKKQMHDFGGMLSFSLVGDNKEEAFRLMSRLKVFTLAESLGGVESLTCHPATMTHASLPKDQRIALGILESLIRLSVGIEDVDDLVEDMENALNSL